MINEAYFSAVLEQYALKNTRSFELMDRELAYFLSKTSWPLSSLLKVYLIMSFPVIYLLGPHKGLTLISKTPIMRSFHEIIKSIILMVHHDN
ncbi:MAG: hypothetical protein CMP00_06300 [Woeseiaceae bacterium]|nr:hypothetical protein [Woeseiaceae bacterium]